MPTHYSVVQYVPDPLAEERINIGIIAVGETEIASRFLENWARVECFAGGADISILKAFAAEVSAASPAQLGMGWVQSGEQLTADSLTVIFRRWTNAIQFTEPAASLRPPHAVLDALSPRFLRIPCEPSEAAPPERRRSRSAAASIAHSAVFAAIQMQRLENVQVRWRAWLAGALEEYLYDSVAENSVPIMAAQGLSFEGGGSDDLERSIDAMGQAIRDVRDRIPMLPIGVVALANSEDEESKPFKRATHLFESYGARLLREHEAQSWAIESAAAYQAHHGIEPPQPPQMTLVEAA